MSASAQTVVRAVLGSFAAWSLGVLLVVEGGLGERYSLHPDNPAQVPEVPAALLQSAQSAVGDIGRYAVIGERPLFNEDRRPLPDAAATAAAPAAPAAPLNVVVTSIVISGKHRIVIVNDPATSKSQVLKVGDSLSGDQSAWKLAELEPRRAVFSGPGGRNSLDLRKFDGQGGEPPTPVALPESAVIQEQPGVVQEAPVPGAAETPESRAESIRRRIEERRRQIREEAERAKAEQGQ